MTEAIAQVAQEVGLDRGVEFQDVVAEREVLEHRNAQLLDEDRLEGQFRVVDVGVGSIDDAGVERRLGMMAAHRLRPNLGVGQVVVGRDRAGGKRGASGRANRGERDHRVRQGGGSAGVGPEIPMRTERFVDGGCEGHEAIAPFLTVAGRTGVRGGSEGMAIGRQVDSRSQRSRPSTTVWPPSACQRNSYSALASTEPRSTHRYSCFPACGTIRAIC